MHGWTDGQKDGHKKLIKKGKSIFNMVQTGVLLVPVPGPVNAEGVRKRI